MAITLYPLPGDDDRRSGPFCRRTRMALAQPCRPGEKHEIASAPDV